MAIEHWGMAVSVDVIKTKLLDMSSDVGNSGIETEFWLNRRLKVGSMAQ